MVYDYLSNSNFFLDDTTNTSTKPITSLNSYSKQPRTLRKSQSLGILAPVATVLRSTASLLHSYRDGLTEEQRAAKVHREQQKQIQHLRLKNATTLDEYNAAANALDILYDNQEWKKEDVSDEYDYKLIQRKLQELDEARINCDVVRMLYLVRTALTRDLGGMGNVRLYKHSYIGTKDLIERYIDSTVETIRSLVKLSERALPEGMETKDVLEQILYARQAFGRSALMLSGGATFGMNHIGVLKALAQANLLPRIISGASAGSIVCSVLCTRTNEEIPETLEKFPYGDLAVFEEAGNEDGILDHVGRFLTQGAWIDIKHLSRVMQELLGNMTFQEAYNRTRRILNICVSSASIYELPRLLNYITSPNVMIWSAVAASCSVPLLFSAAPLLVKNPLTGEHEGWNPSPQKWVDGSVDNDLPMVKLAEMFNVNHFLVSQVNPHVVPFLERDDALVTAAVNSSATVANGADWTFTLTKLAKDEAIHRLQVMSDLGIFPNLVTKAQSILSQKYSGDITILPEINYKDFPRMLKNPTSNFMLDACLRGERATWPKMSRIRNHCAVELELDAAVQSLRAKVVFSPSQVDLRRMSTLTNHTETRRRRVSGSNAVSLSMTGNDGTEEEDSGYFGRGSGHRPPLRAAASHFSTRDRNYLGPVESGSQRSVSPPVSSSPPPSQATMSPRSRTTSSKEPTTPTRKERRQHPMYLVLPQNLPTSETETDLTPTMHSDANFASDFDADVDSHTDDSSPERSELETSFSPSLPSVAPLFTMSPARSRTNSRGKAPGSSHSNKTALEPGPVSLFASSQPPTPGSSKYPASLSLNATTPPSHLSTPGRDSFEAMMARTPIMSPELTMTRGRNRGDQKVGCRDSVEPSSPERKYKSLFHGTKA